LMSLTFESGKTLWIRGFRKEVIGIIDSGKKRKFFLPKRECGSTLLQRIRVDERLGSDLCAIFFIYDAV